MTDGITSDEIRHWTELATAAREKLERLAVVNRKQRDQLNAVTENAVLVAFQLGQATERLTRLEAVFDAAVELTTPAEGAPRGQWDDWHIRRRLLLALRALGVDHGWHLTPDEMKQGAKNGETNQTHD